MAEDRSLPTTQRAYTLRLGGLRREDLAWNDALWTTHDAVNGGARVFGDWLLTMRGGLSASLADEPIAAAGDKDARRPAEIRGRRIALALSWFSAESGVQDGDLPTTRTPETDLAALLKSHGVPDAEIDSWRVDVGPALRCTIRDDARWVNRASVFQSLHRDVDVELARADAQTLVHGVLGSDALDLPAAPERDAEADADEHQAPERMEEAKRQEKLVASSRGAGQRTRHLFSHLFGDSAGFGKPPVTLHLRDLYRRVLEERLAAAAFKVQPGRREDGADGRSPTELHREMLSKAASRLAQIHTKMLQQEVDRERWQRAITYLVELRRQFPAAVKWLEEYEVLGAPIGAGRIGCWDKLVRSWDSVPTGTDVVPRRQQAAKELQAEEAREKFGDINLFLALAEDGACAVWRNDGVAAPEILKRYVRGTDSMRRAERLKVPAYRHPDPYFHPIFCQFGVSRPGIEFDRLDARAGDRRTVRMLLWDGRTADHIPLLAHSKRFDREIGSAAEGSSSPDDGARGVSRRTRQARAAAGATVADSPERVARVFAPQISKPRKGKPKSVPPQWNGTLGADRRALQQLGRLPPEQRARRRRHVRWRLTVSLELQADGPWFHYIDAAPDKSPFERTQKSGKLKGRRYLSYELPPFDDLNSGRGTQAKLMLPRLPGLRVLSVDLGHRYAAACAVWQVVTSDDVTRAAAAARQEPLAPTSMYATVRGPGEKGGTLYRRIGPNAWARLERQFVVKLQGETGDARRATDDEIAAVKRFEERVGRNLTRPRRGRVDELMFDAVATARLALKRHGRRARVAFHLAAERDARSPAELPSDRREESVLDGLVVWHEFLEDRGWDDARARQAWEEHIAPLTASPLPPSLDEANAPARKRHMDELRRALRPVATVLLADGRHRRLAEMWREHWREDDRWWMPKQYELPERSPLRWLRDWILPRGEQGRSSLIRDVGGLSLARIATMKALYQVQKACRMRPYPDNLRKNIPPPGDTSLDEFGRTVLVAMERLRENRVKQLASRIAEAALGIGRESPRGERGSSARPRSALFDHATGEGDPRFAPCHAVVTEDLKNYRPEDTRSRRENRQLMSWASSKVDKHLSEACELAGLHLRRVPARFTSRQDSRTGRPGMRCTDVAIEEFVAEGGWLARRVRVARQDVAGGSREAEPRLLDDLHRRWDPAARTWTEPVYDKDRQEFLRTQAVWRLDDAGVKPKWTLIAGAPRARPTGPRPVRIPHTGGEVFVSSDRASPAARGLQADLNAAANIGLRALLDPDWPGKWWYLPCNPATQQPVREKVAGATVIEVATPLPTESASEPLAASAPKRRGRRKAEPTEIVNYWRDPSTTNVADPAGGAWTPTGTYWARARHRAVDGSLRRLNGLM